MVETAQTQTDRQTNNRIPIIIGFVVFLIISTFILSFLYFSKKDKPKSPNQALLQSSTSLTPAPSLTLTSSPTPGPTSTPVPSPRPIPSGKKTFSVSSAKKTGPQFQGGAIDPYDPKVNSTQTITVAITSSKPVTTGTLTMKTDTKTRDVPMSIVSGTATNGVWAGTWTVDDTYLYTYTVTIIATDNTETNTVELTLR